MPQKSERLYVSIPQITEALGLSRETVLNAIHRGQLPGTVYWQLGPRQGQPIPDKPRKTDRGRWLVPVAALAALLEAYASGAPMPKPLHRALARAAAKAPGRGLETKRLQSKG